MSTVKKITVSIFGEQYKLVSDEHENDIREAARITEATLADLRAKNGYTENQISTLALLKLGLQTIRQEKELMAVQQKAQALLYLVEGILSD